MFYYDVNDDGEYDYAPLADSPTLESPWFGIKDTRVIDLTIVVSGAISSAPSKAALQAILSQQADIAMRRDVYNDWRARIAFNVNTVTVVAPTAAHPDNITTRAQFDAWMTVDNDFVLVNGFHGVFDPDVIGMVKDIGSRGAVMDWDDSTLGACVWLHELGHQFGLRHEYHLADQVMYENTSGGANQLQLKKSDAETFETAQRN